LLEQQLATIKAGTKKSVRFFSRESPSAPGASGRRNSADRLGTTLLTLLHWWFGLPMLTPMANLFGAGASRQRGSPFRAMGASRGGCCGELVEEVALRHSRRRWGWCWPVADEHSDPEVVAAGVSGLSTKLDGKFWRSPPALPFWPDFFSD
jgi:hypothetical protein